MSSTSITLALPTKKAKSIKPPLRKSELIEAMARRKHEQLCEEARKNAADYSAACAEFKKLAEQMAEGMPATNKRDTDWSFVWSGPDAGQIRDVDVYRGGVTIKSEQFTPEMRKQAKIISRLRNSPRSNPEFNDVKRSVRDAMSKVVTDANERINALLSDPATCKAIDRTLAKLENKPETPTLAA